MPIVSVKERHQSRRSTFRNGVMTHLREFLVATDDSPATLSFKPYKKVDWTMLKPFQPATWGQSEAA